MINRDFADPRYKKWRADVRKRDGFKCKMCGSNKKLQVHHIKRWADYPTLRFEISNGITLCKLHHKRMWGREDDFVALCMTLISNGNNVNSLFKKYGIE